MNLPQQDDLPTSRLAACFNSTSATYRFYWFLAILTRVEQGETTISKQHLFAEMVAHSWFTVNYFHVSFGKQDKLQQAIETIRAIESLTIDADRGSIFKRLASTNDKQTLRELNYSTPNYRTAFSAPGSTPPISIKPTLLRRPIPTIDLTQSIKHISKSAPPGYLTCKGTPAS